jgi:hypothetical protein
MVTTNLGALEQFLAIKEVSPLRVINASRVLDTAQSAQGLGLKLTCSHNSNLSTQLKNFVPKAWITQREVGRAQMAIGVLCKC